VGKFDSDVGFYYYVLFSLF